MGITLNIYFKNEFEKFLYEKDEVYKTIYNCIKDDDFLLKYLSWGSLSILFYPDIEELTSNDIIINNITNFLDFHREVAGKVLIDIFTTMQYAKEELKLSLESLIKHLNRKDLIIFIFNCCIHFECRLMILTFLFSNYRMSYEDMLTCSQENISHIIKTFSKKTWLKTNYSLNNYCKIKENIEKISPLITQEGFKQYLIHNHSIASDLLIKNIQYFSECIPKEYKQDIDELNILISL